MRYLIIILLSVLTLTIGANPKKTPQQIYIEQYSEIAVQEMYRSGVPASITLAQGILESGSGRSELAVKSNNHFGIKCHNNWKGARVYHDDDAKGECFRKYSHPEESYRDHSDFLRYRDRYRFLFDYKITDYKSWAYGLKKAGYATDPAYPKKLIKIIEDYKLYEFDVKPTRKNKTKEKKTENVIPESPSQIEQVKPLTEEQREEFSFTLSRKLYSKNGVPFVYSISGESYESIAAANQLFLRELLKFNDLDDPEELKPGTVVYLQKKKRQAAKGLEKHVMEEGETLRDISQRFGLKLKRLYKLNGFETGFVPAEGDIIKLRK